MQIKTTIRVKGDFKLWTWGTEGLMLYRIAEIENLVMAGGEGLNLDVFLLR